MEFDVSGLTECTNKFSKTKYYIDTEGNIIAKACKGCEEVKELSDYSKDKKGFSGTVSKCKQCISNYYRANREHFIEYKKQYYKENKESASEYNRQYREENKERLADYNRQWQEDNRERLSEYNRLYREGNLDIIKENQRQYREKNKERIAEQQLQRYKLKVQDPVWVEKEQERKRKYYIENFEIQSEKQRQRYIENRDSISEYQRQWRERKSNDPEWIEKERVRTSNKKAKRLSVIGNITKEVYREVGGLQGWRCPLTGVNAKDCHLDHFIAANTGWATNFTSNLVLIEKSLNISKNNRNPFIWILTQPEEIQQNFYNILIPEMSIRNNMSVEVFKQYVTFCFDNPLTEEQKQHRRTAWERLQLNGKSEECDEEAI